MNNIIAIQIIISIVLATLVLLQPNDPGMSKSITGTNYAHTRRGSEKIMFQLTIVFAALFVISSIAGLFLN